MARKVRGGKELMRREMTSTELKKDYWPGRKLLMEFLQDSSWDQFYFGIYFNGFSTKKNRLG